MTPKLEEVRDFEWTPYYELHLLHAMGGFKVLGIHQHFMKAVIYEKFCTAIASSAVPSDIVFKKIDSYYNMDQGNKMFKGMPVGGTEEDEFVLPEECLASGVSRIPDNIDDENSMGSKSEGSSSIGSDTSLRKEKGSKLMKKEPRKSSPATLDKKPPPEKKKSSITTAEGKREEMKKGGGGAAAAKKRQSGGERKSERSSRH